MKGKRNSLKINKDILIAIGNRLYDIRRNMRINQKEFAASLDMASGYLSSIEKGNGNPTIGFFYRLSTIHNISLDYLIHGIGSVFKNHKRKKPEDKIDYIDNIETFNDIKWFMENSSMFSSTIIGYCNKFLYENEEIIKENIKRCREKKDKSVL